jgi:RHS repeat-associated protein
VIRVLSDETNTYLYGLERISQTNTGGKDYFMGDALGSVHQLANTSGSVTLSRYYEPHGTTYNAMGSRTTSYGYTSEWSDGNGLEYLRARYYAPITGRFISMDSWAGDYSNPITLNKWVYANGNPVMYTDPSGKWICVGHQDCKEWVNRTLSELSNSGQTGKRIVDFFNQYDKKAGVLQQINTCNLSPEIQFGVQIVFGEPWPGPSWGTAIFRDVLQLSDDPRVINSGTPGGFGLQLFGHEVSHWAQGMIRYTIQGELLSRYVEQQIR